MSDSRDENERPVVLVTGASGLIGRRVCRVLSGRYDVVEIDLNPPEEGEGERENLWIQVDLTKDESVEDALKELRETKGRTLASVIHLAAYYDFSGEPSSMYRELTVDGTRRLMRGLRGFDVRQFVFTSSLLVMKPVLEGQVLDEDSPVQAEWDYPRSKLQAEEVVAQERGDTPCVVLRMAGVYDEDCHSPPIAHQMRRIHERRLESHLFPGDQGHGQSYVHLDDVAECIQKVVDERDKLDGLQTFLVGEPEVVSYGELQDALGRLFHGKEWTTIRVPAPVAKAGAWIKDKLPGKDPFIKPWMIELADAHLPVSIEKARRDLHWKPRHRLRDQLPVMASRLLEDPAEWYATNGIEPPARMQEAR